jgi:undecaprenyl-diphosphatase
MDQHLLFLLNQKWTHPAFDRVLGTLSCLAFWIPILLLVAIWMICKRGIRGQTFVLLCVLGVSANETILSQPLKKWTSRPRPHQTLAHVRRVDLAAAQPRILAIAKPIDIAFSGEPQPNVKNGRSFPSAHVLNAVTLGLTVALCWRLWSWILLAPLMAWSRVYTGAHWPSDVLASLVMGPAFTLLLFWLCDQAWRRWIPGLRPAWAQELPSLVFSQPSATTRRAD